MELAMPRCGLMFIKTFQATYKGNGSFFFINGKRRIVIANFPDFI